MKWNEINYCMSKNKTKGIQCQRDKYKDLDFCVYHKKTKKYNPEILNVIKNTPKDNSPCTSLLDIVANELQKNIDVHVEYLNENYEFGLFGINSSWKEVPLSKWFLLGENWWNIEMLLKSMTTQLNQTEMENPYPHYPINPLTREKLTVESILEIKRICTENNIKMDIVLNRFIHFERRILDRLYKSKNETSEITTIINEFLKTMRFRMINYTNSQNLYCGRWVDKNEEKSQFEKVFDKLMLTNRNELMTNTTNMRLYRNILNMPRENFELLM